MRIMRHFVDVCGRRVHYRRCGAGPALLMVHQSPRSSAELEPLMRRWGTSFTCLAPDTPGFGQSDPLTGTGADTGAFGDAIVAFLDALGMKRVSAYGFHSGGIILVSALRRHPARFSALAVGGYAVWTEQERADFARSYLPPFRPTSYGEHLIWVWNRVLEQTWFFPWYLAEDGARLPFTTDDPLVADAVVRDFLDSGDAYRAGYGAVMQAMRDIPPPGSRTPPVVIAAYDGDPLQAHLDRLGELPSTWRAAAVRTPDELEDLFLKHLAEHAREPAPAETGETDAGFVHVETAGFNGLIHWRGDRTSSRLLLHGPGREASLLGLTNRLLLDLPGHGLSDTWPAAASAQLEDWAAIMASAVAALAAPVEVVEGEGASALLAAETARILGAKGWAGIEAHLPLPENVDLWLARGLPDTTPDRFGCYLTRAWSAVRAAHFFWPWFAAAPEHARAFDPGDIAPEKLAREHRALLRATAAPALLSTLLSVDRAALLARTPALECWSTAPWAAQRHDMWRPPAV